MKALIPIFLLAFLSNLSAQCPQATESRSYLAIPSFFTLYFQGQCVERFMSDTTICVKFPPSSVGRVASFSYSSPSGQPAFVTGYTQYDEQCVMIDNTPLIYPNTDTITLCYTIQAALIDNFCPYGILMPGLAVEFCGVWGDVQDGNLVISWQTCSNAGTHYFEVLESGDMINWEVLGKVSPHYVTTSDQSYYKWSDSADNVGIRYFCIREVDYNGDTTQSDAIVINVPDNKAKSLNGYDLLGRSVQSDNYRYIVKPNR